MINKNFIFKIIIRYQVQHPDCLDNVLKRVISKRGPYDLFTGFSFSTLVEKWFF